MLEVQTHNEATHAEARKIERLNLESPSFQRALSYIHTFQKETVRSQPSDDKRRGFIGLGESKFLVPNKDRFTMLFYWDSYFMMQPLLHTEEGRELAKSTIKAFSMLLDKEGFIPNASTNVFLISSQAPLYSSMIIDTYQQSPANEQDPEWLTHYMNYAKREYMHVWNNEADYKEGTDGIGSFHHYLPEYGLSKYGDRDGDYSWNAERESGWDFTSRFGNVAIEYLPVDLNCFLYKYEMDFAKAAGLLGNSDEKDMWLRKAEERKEKINKYMWNEDKGFFFDYNYVRDKQSPFYSIAPFVTLWSGLATSEQALKMLEHLPKFDKGKGLMVTDKDSLPPLITKEQLDSIGIPEFYQWRIDISLRRREILSGTQEKDETTGKQWDYPHVWAPLEYLTVIGLLKYANNPELNTSLQKVFRDKAKKLMEEYLLTTLAIFEEEGTFPEKFNGVTGKAGNGAHYAKQSGFGWTNAVFQEFAERLLPQLYREEDMLQ